MMNKLFKWVSACFAAAIAFALPLVAQAVVFTGDYAAWSGVSGAVAWRGDGGNFEVSKVADIDTDGNIGEPYPMAWNQAASTTSHRFCSSQAEYTSPGMLLVYDQSGCSADANATFSPLSFGGLWVKALSSESTPYSVSGASGNGRYTDFGAAGESTYFKFEKSFTVNRQHATRFFGTATVEIADGATFTAQDYSGTGVEIGSAASLVLVGDSTGTFGVGDGLSVNGTLDLSAATRPTISGDVTLAADSTIVLPAGTTVDTTTPFVVCSGTLTVSGPVNVKIGTAAPVSASLTVDNGGITLIETTTTYTATINGNTAFSAISWEKDGVAATISDISTAILELSGSGKVTGLSDAPVSIDIASGVVFDMTSVSNVGSIELKGAGTFLFTANYPTSVPVGLHYEYQGGVDAEHSVAIADVTVGGTLTTSGFVALNNFELSAGGTYEVATDGYATVSAKAQKKLSGNITIGERATFVNANTTASNSADALNYDAHCVITVRGTLSMGNTRWSLRGKSYHEFRLYDGAVISGAGQYSGQTSYGAFDYIESESGAQIDTYGGNVTVSAGIRVRAGANVAFWVEDGATNTISGTTLGAGTFSKSGTGTLNLTGTIGNGMLSINEGCVNVGSSMDVNIGCNNANGYVTASDDVVVGGTIALASTTFTPNDVLKTFLQNSSAWHGTLSVPAIANDDLNASFLTTYGNSESLIALGGISGAKTYIMASGNTTYNVGGVRIDGATEFNNGSSGSTVNFAKLTGTNDLTLVGWSGCSSARYNLNKVEGYTGALTVKNAITREQGGTFTIGIGDIVTATTPNPGDCVLPIVSQEVENPTGTVVYNLDNATLNGVATNLVAQSDGIYLKGLTATITYADGTTEDSYDSLMTILLGLYMGYTPEKANAVVTVLDGSDETFGDSLSAYDYDSTAHTYTLKTMVASYQIGTTTFFVTNLASIAEAAVLTNVTATLLVDLDMSGEAAGLVIPASVTYDDQQYALHPITLDLGGKTVTGPATGYVLVNEGNTVTIVGEGTVTGVGIVSNATSSAVTVISNGTYTATGDLFSAEEGSTIAVSGGTYNKSVADEYLADGFEVYDAGNGKYGIREELGWIYEAADHPSYTGSWSNEVAYSEGKITFEDGNTYTANRPSDGRMVTLEMTISFDDVNDENEDVGDVKAAVKLGTDGFMVYTSEGPDGAVTSVWKTVEIDGLELLPVANVDYTFLFALDLTNKTYTASLVTSGGAATNALTLASSANIPFACRDNDAPVQKIDFVGAGSLTSIFGEYEDPEVAVEFVDGQVVGSVTLTAAQAAWLNSQNNYEQLYGKISELAVDAFNEAYLLNLDVASRAYDGTNVLMVTGIAFGKDSGDNDTVIVTVTLTRHGAIEVNGNAAPIIGTLKVKGGSALPASAFEAIQSVDFVDADFSEGDTTTCTFLKGDAPAKFYQAVIE